MLSSICSSNKACASPASIINIPLQERAHQLDKIKTIVNNNLNNMLKPSAQISEKGKTDLIIPAFIGGAGIGKVCIIMSYLLDLTYCSDNVGI